MLIAGIWSTEPELNAIRSLAEDGRGEMTPEVRGVQVDAQTRCTHYGSPLDVIAIKMKCCRTYFACKDCHDALADHPLEPWPRKERGQRAVLCGVCGSELTIAQYLERSENCVICEAAFNPGCRAHHADYFSGA